MSLYKVAIDSGSIETLTRFSFKSEGEDLISPQELIYNNPKLIINIPELELQSSDNIIVTREFNTNRGPIDVLMITSNADVIIVETKLLRNPESHRAVVAQAIDYVKAFYSQSVKELIETLLKSKYTNQDILAEMKENDLWLAALGKNLAHGNFQLLILGDKIHPNVLGMVESIQSAPHMAFTIFLIELDPFADDGNGILLNPRVVAKTIEVERSVIRIQINHEKRTHAIESEVPEAEGKGTKPIITSEQFINNFDITDFIKPIERFWQEWRELGGDIRFGTVGFSAGIMQGDKRIPIFYVYPQKVSTVSETTKNLYNIPDDIYQKYKDELKASQTIYDGYVVGNKVEVPYELISVDELELIFKASINIAKQLTASQVG
jgi:hypothetical protein